VRGKVGWGHYPGSHAIGAPELASLIGTIPYEICCSVGKRVCRVYVRPELRRQGVYKLLYRHVQDLAANDPAVCGFRLYVEHENARAQATYRALGMKQTRYLVFEELKPGVKFYR